MDPIKKTTARLLACLSWIALLFAAFSCQSDRKDPQWQNQNFLLDEEIARQSKDSVDFILKKAMQYNTRFETFSAQLDIRLQGEGQGGFSFGGQLRVSNGQVLWASLSKFFIEPFRIRLTPDTLVLWNKLDNSALLYVDTGTEKAMPLLFRFGQCLMMRQIDTLMFEGERTLSSPDPETWSIRGLLPDSIVWECRINKDDFRTQSLMMALSDQGNQVQIALSYLEGNGFELRFSVNGHEAAKARIRYEKQQWNKPLRFPMNLTPATRIQINHGFIEQSRNLPSSSL